MKKITSVFLIWVLACIMCMGQCRLYVGQRQLLAAPNPPGNSALYNTAWGSSGEHLSLEKSYNSCYVKVEEYFEGIEQVQCDYYWYWYDNYGRQHTNHATTFYNVTCLPVTLSLNITEMTLNIGEEKRLDYSCSPSSVSPKPTVRFVSRNTNIVTVNDNGYVRAVSSGTTYIDVVNSSGPDVQCRVSVRKVDPTEVRLNSYQTVYVGESVTLTPKISPSYATTTFTWYSTDNNVAKVSPSGSVMGLKEGVAYIYAVTNNGMRTNNCEVNVCYRKPTDVSISPNTLSLPISRQSTLRAIVSPSNAKYTLVWSTNNSKVVSVSQSGVVVALGSGKATISVRTDNGCVGQCDITVPPDPSKISIPSRISLMYKSKRKLNLSVLPENAFYDITWKSSNDKVAMVSPEGTVTALRPGKADITATTQNGKSATCRVEVEEPRFDFKAWMEDGSNLDIALERHPLVYYKNKSLWLDTYNGAVELDTNSVRKFTIENNTKERMPEAIKTAGDIELRYGTEAQLLYKLYPTNYDILTTLKWTTDNPDVVSVSETGSIMAKSPGKAEITVTASNGTTTKTVVSVPEPVFPMFVFLGNGYYDTYYLSDRPKVSYNNNKLIVTSDIGEMHYDAAKVRKFSFVEEDVSFVTKTETLPTLKEQGLANENGEVKIRGLEDGGMVHVYTANGQLYKTYRALGDGSVSFRLSSLPKGVYLIKTKTQTFKFIKK